MANDRNGGDSASIDWSFATSQAFLPPRSPLFSSGVPGLLENVNNTTTNSLFSNWTKAPLPNASGHRRHHHRTPSTSFLPQTPAWVDELLNDTPDVPPPKNLHRRSSSDSLAFLEAPLQHVRITDITEEELDLGRIGSSPNKNASHNTNANMRVSVSPLESRSPFEVSSTLSDRDSANASSVEDKRPGGVGHLKNDTEAQSVLKADNSVGKGENLSSGDASLDPKRAKRILANRQSAQRSRVRKLQYIAELERTVNVLQEEVSALSPQVTYLDRHRILLNVDNSAMKQRIAALAQEKLFKDAHNEALKLEVHRLRQLYQQQQQKHTNLSCETTTQQRFSSQLELKDLDIGLDATKYAEYVFKEAEAELIESHGPPPPRSPLSKPLGPSSCSSGEKVKVLHGQAMPAGLEQQLHTDFRVQNA